MPELPEVETTRRGLLPLVQGKRIEEVIVRERRLRWPVPRQLAAHLTGKTVGEIRRRGKYLLWGCDAGGRRAGWLLSHLGMSGTLQAVAPATPLRAHDHLDLVFDDTVVRFNDPRRFGAMLWIAGEATAHPLLDELGPEPFDAAFNADYLFALSRNRAVPIKSFIMNAAVVVGVGNIYAAEALFHAGIHPARAAGRISHPRYVRLVEAIQRTLGAALNAGGSTLRNYVGSGGEPGYFQLATMVYGRDGEPCRLCKTLVKVNRQGQRSTFFCPRCQR